MIVYGGGEIYYGNLILILGLLVFEERVVDRFGRQIVVEFCKVRIYYLKYQGYFFSCFKVDRIVVVLFKINSVF